MIAVLEQLSAFKVNSRENSKYNKKMEETQKDS